MHKILRLALSEVSRYTTVGIIMIDISTYVMLTTFSRFSDSWSKHPNFAAGEIWCFIGNNKYTSKTQATCFKEPMVFIAVYLDRLFDKNDSVRLGAKFLKKIIAIETVIAALVLSNFIGQKYLFLTAKKTCHKNSHD